MRFSWTGQVLAPLLVPMVFRMIGAAMVSSPQEAGISSLADPGLRHILWCHDIPPRALPVSALFVEASDRVHGLPGGTALMFVPLTWLEWKSSGPDSDPPTETFLVLFVRWTADPLTAMFPLAGLITAGLYWWLVTQRRGRSIPSPG